MESNKNRVFIVIEEHMQERYTHLINKYGYKNFCLKDFQGLNLGASFSHVFKRIYYREILNKEYNKLRFWIEKVNTEVNIEVVYLSNSEGYIAHNIARRLRYDFPEITLIALQHGIFDMSRIPKRFSRLLINKFCWFFFKICPLGVGFGGKIVDQYIVYNEAYKDFLMTEYKWKDHEVKVDLSFLKSELFEKKVTSKKEDDTAIFLLQCLAKAKLCSAEQEHYLNTKTLTYLSKKYTKVLIKEHPAATENHRVELMQNCEYIDNLIEGFNRSSFAYSYSSTALLDAEIFDIETFAIKSEKLKWSKDIYKLFKNTINFENEIDI
ncbi:polysialyltransferase family glycosyltransferase [uncultured Aquimarina sp.]|uniref:polysialyltransferase family glycosyltransferase n=1 Tax=uncultured Aquimarina sp. TaxID=575652 RepID=UPI0026358AC9|nr:polysialyltransferase family glycosyltransferase [uncultured Aquimarina sp.]